MRHCDKKAVTVNPTNKCNLRCTYCMASSAEVQGNILFIDIEFAKCGIRDALKGFPNGIPAEILRFFSPGEPTQNMPCIKECVTFAKNLQPSIKTELQTNGLFEEENDCKWIADNIDIVWFSLDGPKEINGKYRLGMDGQDKTEIIEENLKYVQRKTFVGIRATITKETLDHQVELVDYYHRLGIKYLYANPEIERIKQSGSTNCKRITIVDMKRFIKGFLHGYKRAKELGMYYGNSFTFNFDERTEVACRSCLPMPQLNPDGSVSSCDMALYKNAPTELQHFLYGEWNHNLRKIVYDLDKINYLQNRNINNLPKCKSCGIREYCAGGCAGRIAYEKGNIYDVVPEFCAQIKFLAQNLELNRNVVCYTHP